MAGLKGQSLFLTPQDNLGGRMLRMTTLEIVPFIIRHQKENSTWYTGFCMDLLDILTTALNFTYVIIEPADQSWGQQLPNKTWIGMTGMLYRKEVDFALSGMSVTPSRATVSDYTTGFYYGDVGLISTLPDPTSLGWNFVIRPFHWMVYLLLGGCALLLTGMSAWLQTCHLNMHNSNRAAPDGKTAHAQSVAGYMVEAGQTLFGALLGRAVVYKGASSSRCSSRILLSSWLLLSLVTVAMYNSKLASNSFIQKQRLPFNTLSELVKRTDYRWGLPKGTIYESDLSKSTNKDYRRFYQKTSEFTVKDPDIMSDDWNTVILPKLLKGGFVYLDSTSMFKVSVREHCQLTVAKERLFHDIFAIHLQKGSPYTTMFNKVVNAAREFGLLEALTWKWFPENSGCRGSQTTSMPVSLELLKTAFVMAACGLLLSAMLLALERLAKCRSPKHSRVACQQQHAGHQVNTESFTAYSY